MKFQRRATPKALPSRWLCHQCGLHLVGTLCPSCGRPRHVTQEENEIVAHKANQEHLRSKVNPRTWACLKQLERLALDDPDAGIRDRAATWLCAVLHAAERGQEMKPEEVDHVFEQVGARVPVS
jgi:uncharacterized Zn finger protein (UPF0148 family)